MGCIWRATLVSLSLLAAAPQGAACSGITEATERLSCFDGLAACAGEHADQARLACYDAVARAAGSSAVSRSQEEAFPVEGRARLEGQPPQIMATVVRVTRDRMGRRLLTLDNGQVWRELRQGRFDIALGTAVEIRRGILGSVNLRAEGRDAFIKVRRIE